MRWSFYDELTGAISKRTYQGPERYLDRNTPTGHVAIAGEYDWLSQRVDVATGEVVAYRPPQPDAEHEWNATIRRWVKRPDIVARDNRDAAAREKLREIDLARIRPLAELAMNPLDAAALARLTSLEAQAVEAREDLKE
jgi:hypothetical protein